MRVSVLASLAASACLAGAGPAAAQNENTVFGYWETPGDDGGEADSIVELRRCPDAPANLCGHIEWLAPDEPRTDSENPEPELRDRPLIGLQFLSGFEQESPGEWTGGEVYNPDDGRTYSGSIEQTGPDTLQLEGCALRIFCKSQTWHRVSADDPRLQEQEGG